MYIYISPIKVLTDVILKIIVNLGRLYIAFS